MQLTAVLNWWIKIATRLQQCNSKFVTTNQRRLWSCVRVFCGQIQNQNILSKTKANKWLACRPKQQFYPKTHNLSADQKKKASKLAISNKNSTINNNENENKTKYWIKQTIFAANGMWSRRMKRKKNSSINSGMCVYVYCCAIKREYSMLVEIVEWQWMKERAGGWTID